MKNFDFISLYCGADNLGDGIVQAGGKLKLAIDQVSDCCETVKLNNPDAEVICGKVSDYISTLPNADAVVGGPPCPEFSRAKTDRTFDMCEVNNFWEAIRVVNPKHYFMENVQDIKKKLYKSSYLVNCADYGVPQTRVRRIFTNLPLPSPTHTENPQNNLFGNTLKKWVSVKEALNLDGILEDRKTTFGEKYNKEDGKFRQYSTEKPSYSLITDARPFYISVDAFKKQNGIELTRDISEMPAQTVMASRNLLITDYKIYSLKYLQDKNPKMTSKHKPNNLDNPAYTVDTKDRGETTSGMISDGKYARKLTNEELSILQGFRKDFHQGLLEKQVFPDTNTIWYRRTGKTPT